MKVEYTTDYTDSKLTIDNIEPKDINAIKASLNKVIDSIDDFELLCFTLMDLIELKGDRDDVFSDKAVTTKYTLEV